MGRLADGEGVRRDRRSDPGLHHQPVGCFDYHGSGAETVAHLRDNGRITLMFVAFEGPPDVVRPYGRGSTVPIEDPASAELLAAFPADGPDRHGSRAVVVEVDRIGDSCGFAVPLMGYQGDRDLLLRRHSRRSEADLAEYRTTRNGASIDGLPAFT